MIFTSTNDSKAKGNVVKLIYPTLSRPITNKDINNLFKIKGPYPTYIQTTPQTETKTLLLPVDSGTYNYYDRFEKKTITGNVTCTGGTSLPICRKKLPRPLKIWRRQLDPNSSTSKNNITINLLNQPTTVVTHNSCEGDSKNIYLEQLKENVCDGIKNGNQCIGGTNRIIRSAGTIISKKYSTTHSEYLQKRVKTFEQNQTLGKNISTNTFKSALGVEPTTDVPNVCNRITFKPSNIRFHQQGGVTSSGRTNMTKYMTLMKDVNNNDKVNFKNFATSQTTLNNGNFFVKDNRCIKYNRMNGSYSIIDQK
jgi:hypothetical protein